jgi:molybdate transport system ATP-binding protein
MSDSLVSFRNVTIRVPNGDSFPDISFEVKKGEHWAFIGENESLKNALLEALAGNVAVVNGSAEFPFFEKYKAMNGSDPFFSPHRFIAKITERHQFRNLSNTQQFYYQQRFNSSDSEDTITVLEYLEQAHAYRDFPELGLQEMVAKMKLAPLLDKQLIKLSHGETKRLLIASALLRHPEILLFSNPFTGLDAATRKELQQLINDIAARGVTIIISASAAEIPESITHVATFEKDNTISICLKQTFEPQTETPQDEPTIDEAEISSLLSLQRRPPFEDIVLMKNVRIQYGEKIILDNINWSIKQGERWAVSGPNGAGKSTLLSLINADNPQAFANHIVLFDRRKGTGESIWDIKKKIGFFSPELYQYFPLETSCLQAVESGFYDTIGLFRQTEPRLMSIALRWMKLLGVEELGRKLLSQVSNVNQRLCLLARAFVKSPPLLILDEPCQGFNEHQVKLFKAIVNAVCAASNTTLIYVTHYKEEIPECVTRIFQLENGKQVD